MVLYLKKEIAYYTQKKIIFLSGNINHHQQAFINTNYYLTHTLVLYLKKEIAYYTQEINIIFLSGNVNHHLQAFINTN